MVAIGVPIDPMSKAPPSGSKPWWRRWNGFPGDLRQSDLAPPAVSDPTTAARIVVRRDDCYRDAARAYNVYIDEQAVALLGNGEEVNVNVKPGEHRVRLTIGALWSSKRLGRRPFRQ